MAPPTELLWAFIGLLLTIGGTFLEASIAMPPWRDQVGLHTHSLGVTAQIAAVLLVGCMGGRNAGALSQIAYLTLGLTPWFPIFTQGGGLGYLREPSFGYLLGFVPGAWVCGYLAFKTPVRLESLTFSCLSGLITIHATGFVYLLLVYLLGVVNAATLPLGQALLTFSVYPLPGHLALVCTVAVLTFVLRNLMFY